MKSSNASVGEGLWWLENCNMRAKNARPNGRARRMRWAIKGFDPERVGGRIVFLLFEEDQNDNVQTVQCSFLRYVASQNLVR